MRLGLVWLVVGTVIGSVAGLLFGNFVVGGAAGFVIVLALLLIGNWLGGRGPDEDDIRSEGRRFAREVIVPSDESGMPVSHLVPIKPNITGGGGNDWATMGIITDPNFVEGMVMSMKDLGISRKKFHLREVNCINWKKAYQSI